MKSGCQLILGGLLHGKKSSPLPAGKPWRGLSEVWGHRLPSLPSWWPAGVRGAGCLAGDLSVLSCCGRAPRPLGHEAAGWGWLFVSPTHSGRVFPQKCW